MGVTNYDTLKANRVEATTLVIGDEELSDAITDELISLGAAIPTAAVVSLTDSTGGAAADGTLAANSAIGVMAIPLVLARIANGDLLTNWTPGFKGTLLGVAAFVADPATTADKLATLNLEIDAVNVTGGVLSLTSANMTPLGAVVAATAITAANVFTAVQTISIEASGVTAFVEGEIVLLITYASDLVDDNFKDLAVKLNELLTTLRTAGIITP